VGGEGGEFQRACKAALKLGGADSFRKRVRITGSNNLNDLLELLDRNFQLRNWGERKGVLEIKKGEGENPKL